MTALRHAPGTLDDARLAALLPPEPPVPVADDPLLAQCLPSPLGTLLAAASPRAIVLLEFADAEAPTAGLTSLGARLRASVLPASARDTTAPGHRLLALLRVQLDQYFAGRRQAFDLPLDAPGTPFQAAVWHALRGIPFGSTRSYLDVARAIGRPTATRAVARANGDNRIAILIPCHRVIGAGGTLTGYGGGLWRKEHLLRLEGAWL